MEFMQHMATALAEAFKGKAVETTTTPAYYRVMREFLRLNPPTFMGGLDPMIVES